MKKIGRTIALLLVLVILAGSFTSCFTLKAIDNADYKWLILTIPLDIITLPLQAIALAMGINIFASGETEPQIYLANAEYSTLAEYNSLIKKVYSLPEAELSSLKQTINLIPETERGSAMEKIFSLREEKFVSMIRIYNSLSEREIVSSIERLKALPEAELVSILRAFNSLSESELDSIINESKSLAERENVVLMDNLPPLPKPEYVVTGHAQAAKIQ